MSPSCGSDLYKNQDEFWTIPYKNTTLPIFKQCVMLFSWVCVMRMLACTRFAFTLRITDLLHHTSCTSFPHYVPVRYKKTWVIFFSMNAGKLSQAGDSKRATNSDGKERNFVFICHISLHVNSP